MSRRTFLLLFLLASLTGCFSVSTARTYVYKDEYRVFSWSDKIPKRYELIVPNRAGLISGDEIKFCYSNGFKIFKCKSVYGYVNVSDDFREVDVKLALPRYSKPNNCTFSFKNTIATVSIEECEPFAGNSKVHEKRRFDPVERYVGTPCYFDVNESYTKNFKFKSSEFKRGYNGALAQLRKHLESGSNYNFEDLEKRKLALIDSKHGTYEHGFVNCLMIIKELDLMFPDHRNNIESSILFLDLMKIHQISK